MVWVPDTLHPQPLKEKWRCQLPHQVHRHRVGLEDNTAMTELTQGTNSSTGKKKSSTDFRYSLFQFRVPTSLKSDWVLQRKDGQGMWCLEVFLASSVPHHFSVVVHNPKEIKCLFNIWNLGRLSYIGFWLEMFWTKTSTYRQRKKFSIDLYAKTVWVIIFLRATRLWQAKSGQHKETCQSHNTYKYIYIDTHAHTYIHKKTLYIKMNEGELLCWCGPETEVYW